MIKLLSPGDSLSRLQEKMEEYLANGASLGWIIDPFRKEVHVYHPEVKPEKVMQPATVTGEGLVTGFILDLGAIFAE